MRCFVEGIGESRVPVRGGVERGDDRTLSDGVVEGVGWLLCQIPVRVDGFVGFESC